MRATTSVRARSPALPQTATRGCNPVLNQPKVRQTLEMDGGKVQILDSAAYSQAFGQELKFTETMMRRIGLQAV